MSHNDANHRRYFPPVFDFPHLFPSVREWRATFAALHAKEPGVTDKLLEQKKEAVRASGFPARSRILISGEAGVGKTTFALALIRGLMVDWDPKQKSAGPPCEPWRPADGKKPHCLYYLSTEVDRARLEHVFGQYGWFTEKDALFGRGRMHIPQIPVGSMRLPIQGAHELVDLVLAQLKANVADAPPNPTFVLVDSLTAILKDSRDAGERRREALEFMDRIEKTLGKERQAPMFLISERGAAPDPVAYAEEIAVDFVFHLGRRPTSPGRLLRTLTITKSAGVDMLLGEHSWALVGQDVGLDRVIAERKVVQELVRAQMEAEETVSGVSDPWGTVCVFPRPQLPPIGERNEDPTTIRRQKADATTATGTSGLETGTPGLDELLNSALNPDYWINSALEPAGERPAAKGALIEGTTTLLVGTAGTGKTTACLQFLNQVRDPRILAKTPKRPETPETPAQDVLYINFEQPVSRVRQFFRDESSKAFKDLFKTWYSIYRRRGNLDVNVLLAEVRHVIGARKIRRVAVDGLSDLLATTEKEDYALLVELLVGTIRDAARDRVTTFVTFELEAQQSEAGRVTIEGLSAAADNVVVLRQLPINDELRKTAHVLKARGMSPDRQVRAVEIRDDDDTYPLRIVDALESYSGLLSGKPEPVNVVLQLFAENDAERLFNSKLKVRLGEIFRYPIHLSGFSRSAMNRTLEDFTSPTSRVPPTDIKVLSLDEWWIREFGARSSASRSPASYPLLPLDLFFVPRRSGHVPSQQQFWFFEIEKASVLEPLDEKSAQDGTAAAPSVPASPPSPPSPPAPPGPHPGPKYEAHLLGVPNYTDFGLFCFNPVVALRCAQFYNHKANHGEQGDRELNAWRAGVMRALAESAWPATLDLIPRTWAGQHNASPPDSAPFGFAPPNTTKPATGTRPAYLVDLLQLAVDAGCGGFCFDGETAESVVCNFIEFCWNFGASEDFLRPGGGPDQAERVEEAVRFLQYLAYHGLMSPKSKLDDTRKCLFSRQWYSTLSEVRAARPGQLAQAPDLKVLPFFPLGAVANRASALAEAYADACSRLKRLPQRIRAALIYRSRPENRGAAVAQMERIEDQINRLQGSRSVTSDMLNSLWQIGEQIRVAALGAEELRRGVRVERDEGNPRLQSHSEDDESVQDEMRRNLAAARSLNIRDVLELLGWHRFRVLLMRAEFSGKSISTAVEADMSGGELSGADPAGADPAGADPAGADPAGAELTALTGFCCSGSWMLGAGRQTHSPHLSWKLIDEMTSLEQAKERAELGAGIPVRKDFYDAHGDEPVRHAEHLSWNKLLRYGECRCRRRDRIVAEERPLKDLFQELYVGLLDCLTVAEAARARPVPAQGVTAAPPGPPPEVVDAVLRHGRRVAAALFQSEGRTSPP